MKSLRAAPAAVFVLTAVCFLGCLRNGWVWDDWEFLVKTQGYRGLDWSHLAWMFGRTADSCFSPLAWLTYAVDYRLWGLDPLGFHLTNVLLHAANAVLLYLLARVLLPLIRPASPARLAAAALVAALFFGLHPLRVESVAWASERRDVLAGFFFLGSVLSHVRAARAATDAARRRARALSVLAAVLAGLSKPTMVPLPLALLALDFYPLRRLEPGSPKRVWAARLLEKLPYAAVAGVSALLTLRAQRLSHNLATLSQYGLESRAAQAVYGLGFYLAKTVWPFGLSILYPRPARLSLLGAQALAGAAVLAAAEGALRLSGVGGRARAALWLYYAAMLLPVLGLVSDGSQLVALRYSYLSCLGWALLAAAAVLAPRGRAAAAGVVLGAFLCGAAALTQRQLALWSDDVTAWSAQVEMFPDSLAGRLNLATAYNSRGDGAAAERHARAALALDPGNATAVYDLAGALDSSGRVEEARALLEEASARNPNSAELLGLLAWTTLELGRKPEALANLRKAVALSPDAPHLQFMFGSALLDAGKTSEALEHLSDAARLQPGEPRYLRAVAQAERRQAKAP